MKNLKSHDKGRTFKRIQYEVQRAGYWFGEKNAQVMHTAYHTDIPRNRDRIFMVALSCDVFPANVFELRRPHPAESPGMTRLTRL
ncbi:MAG: DNA cytosine methyltransferase [Candidatus Acidiferrales bacterium]